MRISVLAFNSLGYWSAKSVNKIWFLSGYLVSDLIQNTRITLRVVLRKNDLVFLGELGGFKLSAESPFGVL
jgi:hypothetical protein